MIEIEYRGGVRERRTFIRGDEMSNPRIVDVLVFGDLRRTHTARLMGAM